MKSASAVFVAGALALLLTSCVSAVYTREWTVNNARLSDTLAVSGDRFRLERAGQSGTSVFEGALIDLGEQWILDVDSLTTPDGTVRRFEPPVRYIYSVKVFLNGVSFLSLISVEGDRTFTFIPRGDFEIR